MRVGNCTEILPGVAAGRHTNGVIKRPMFVHPPQLTVAGHVVHSSVGKLAKFGPGHHDARPRRSSCLTDNLTQTRPPTNDIWPLLAQLQDLFARRHTVRQAVVCCVRSTLPLQDPLSVSFFSLWTCSLWLVICSLGHLSNKLLLPRDRTLGRNKTIAFLNPTVFRDMKDSSYLYRPRLS